jgi:PIN domain nuclease of toxin-antitoxin system
MAAVVFDASAILALLRDETGAEIVARHIGDGLISAINFQEVVKELIRRGVSIEAAEEMLDALHLDVRAHGRNEAIMAASLYPATRQHGSGLGDRSCMALALAEKLPALTADRAWSTVAVDGLEIQLIR